MQPRSALFARPNLVRNEVYEHLKLEILTGQLEAGAKLAEIPLAQRLNVSRTPVREAVQRLAQDGLVEVEANKGARVRGISADEVRDVYAVREVLDGLAAKLAAQHRTANDLKSIRSALTRLENAPKRDYAAQIAADLEFHNAVAFASQNAALESTLRAILESVARVKLLTREYNQSEGTRDAHHAIFAAIERQDASAAESAARSHVRDFQKMILERIAPALEGGKHG
jgi:DNA-binding GntR family transcriptional regulator